MKYKNREVEELNIYVKLGDKYKADNITDFNENQEYVADILIKNNILNWEFTEAVMDDLVRIATNAKTVEEINDMFIKVKPLFNNVEIGVFYDDFGEFDYNEESFNNVLDVNLFYV